MKVIISENAPDPLLMEALHALQGKFDDGISEYALLQALQAPPWHLFQGLNLSDSLAMFQMHFVLFNALYTLSDEWQNQGETALDIHTLKIIRKPVISSESSTQSGSVETTELNNDDPLRAYYLDWRNLKETDRNGVEKLLNGFWERFVGGGYTDHDVNQAKRILGFDANSLLTAADIKRQYRKLLQTHHPDKGGSTEASQRITEAYRVLSRIVR
ncbi:molecular chaperone DnaJ [Aestuariibacter sp. GS-14]|uniref:DNA-J related domain-containing protein n=1 Tax=Aestuariibacter sp. GS-14 TaxID=2590670 RepID=UPI00112BB972|nr:DNA-J related domain-containing protein [Aestuariibacter sp. GS-14]TPV58521.1 molecular chaperone DnaJ [Aestuariibacter sp. GS-14]